MEKVYDLDDIRSYDIETPRGGFLFIDKDLVTRQYHIFRIDRFVNQLEELVHYLLTDKPKYYVGFRNLGFDAQVVQWILDNSYKWFDIGGERIAKMLYQYAKDIIDDANHGIWPPYREEELWCPQIDLFTLHHFDNEARRTSLKWVEFSLDMDNIEDLPMDIHAEYLSEEEIVEEIRYCCNDNDANEGLYWTSRGVSENEEYKGKDMILDRLSIIEEKGLPMKALSWSNVKIGEQLNMKGYCKRTGLTPKKVKELKEGRKSNAGFTFGDCIPDYVKFKTPKFQEFMERVSRVRVNLNESEEKEEGHIIESNGTTLVIKRGGIHSNEKKRRIIVEEGWRLRDADIGSQYPNAINKRNIFPNHLGPEWNIEYRTNTHERTHVYKPKSKDKTLLDWRRYVGVTELMKYALNGGGYGMLNLRSSWQYDPFCMHQCTIGNQFEILMLIEALELEGIHIVSANTDGIVSHYPLEKEDTYMRVCEEWERQVGNDVDGKLEFAEYKKLIQTSVNVYIALKDDGSVKKKGTAFLTSHELNKNKSRRIVALALENYFMKEIPVEETIRNHKNIWDFCIGKKSNRDYHYNAISRDGSEEKYHTRVVRYFVSNKGSKLLKVKNVGSEAPGPEISNVEKGSWLCTVYNKAVEKDVTKLDINYDYYIGKTLEIIEGIENPRKKKIYRNPDQISLF